MERIREAEGTAAQRLRKTFQYPSESDDESAVENGMDRQDQETLIHDLAAHDTSATRTYTLLLLGLPLAPIPFYLPRLLAQPTSIPSLAAMASLLATAYALYFLPLAAADMDEPVDGHAAVGSSGRAGGKAGQRAVPAVSGAGAEGLARYVVLVNRAVCGLLALYEVWLGRGWRQGVMIGGGFLPGIICMVILYARTELRMIDVEQLRRWQEEGRGVDAGTRLD